MNPFTLTYHPDYFCNRLQELTQLKENLLNGLNTLVHSPRRLGKSALIRHLFHQLENEKMYETVYIDLFATKNMEDLVRIFAENVLDKYHSKNLLQGIKKLLKGITPTLSFSEEGTPVLSLNLTDGQAETSIRHVFKYLESRNKKVVVAFDEFQQVAIYPEEAEAILRSHIQKLTNVQFIFSGSSNHILQNMFYSASRPFYQSSEVLVLDKIEPKVYRSFIESFFTKFSKQIESEALEYIMTFTEGYTYYTQVVCNQLFFRTEKRLDKATAIDLTSNYIENRKFDYLGIYNLLAENHKKVVVAVAKEGMVQKPTSIEFLMKYKLPSASSTLQSINALTEKEILYKTNEGYVVYDIFFRRFLQRYY